MIIKNKKFNNGFTLIELMVATSLFLVIMISAMSALFMLLGESKNSRALRFAMDNVNFAMDSMTRSIRMGTNYSCGDFSTSNVISASSCHEGNTLFSFVPQGDTLSRVGYKLEGSMVKRYDTDNQSGVPVVSPDVKINELRFFVRGSGGTTSQPSVYIIMKGAVIVKGVPVSFAVQTMASQRNF